jgi:Amt family ammonium transporter
MLSAGSVRAKNAKNIILLNLLDACFGCMAWYVCGYAFAFGDPSLGADGVYTGAGSPFIGHRFFAQAGMPAGDLVKWFFQFTFAATCEPSAASPPPSPHAPAPLSYSPPPHVPPQPRPS